MTAIAELHTEPLLKPEEVAARLVVSTATLQIWRMTGRYGLAYIKAGKHVRYRRSDVEAFIRRRTVRPEQGQRRCRAIEHSTSCPA